MSAGLPLRAISIATGGCASTLRTLARRFASLRTRRSSPLRRRAIGEAEQPKPPITNKSQLKALLWPAWCAEWMGHAA